jgi:hypothetical protein
MIWLIITFEKTTSLKTLFTLFLILFFLITYPVQATVIMPPTFSSSYTISTFAASASSALPVTSGKEQTFFSRVLTRLTGKKIIRTLVREEEMTARQKKQAKWSLILGISSIALLLIPYAGLLAIPASITAIILGIKSLKGNSNARGIAGIATGSLTVVIVLAAIAVIAFASPLIF